MGTTLPFSTLKVIILLAKRFLFVFVNEELLKKDPVALESRFSRGQFIQDDHHDLRQVPEHLAGGLPGF